MVVQDGERGSFIGSYRFFWDVHYTFTLAAFPTTLASVWYENFRPQCEVQGAEGVHDSYQSFRFATLLPELSRQSYSCCYWVFHAKKNERRIDSRDGISSFGQVFGFGFYPLVNIQKSYGKSAFLTGKSHINDHFIDIPPLAYQVGLTSGFACGPAENLVVYVDKIRVEKHC